MAKSTPARCNTRAIDRAIRWLLDSNADVHPTQNSASACGCSDSVFTPNPSAHCVRENSLPRHGCPRCSMLNSASIAVSGIFDCSSTR